MEVTQLASLGLGPHGSLPVPRLRLFALGVCCIPDNSDQPLLGIAPNANSSVPWLPLASVFSGV